MANKFNQLLATEDYGQPTSKLSTVLIHFILICDLPIEEKLNHIFTIFAITDDQPLSTK